MSINLGATVETTFTTAPAETGTLTVRAPDGTLSSPTVTGPAGDQAALFEAAQVGTWTATWDSPNAGQYVETFTVGPTVVSLTQVKQALNKTDTADDGELQRLMDAALAEYAEWVGPLPGDRTVRTAGGSPVVLPVGTSAVVSAETADGTAVDTVGYDLDVASGLLYGAGTYAARGLVLTVTVGGLPANHVEAIIADVAEYWRRTQRGGGSGRPSFGGGGAGDFEEVSAGRPLVLFPRIRSLAGVTVA